MEYLVSKGGLGVAKVSYRCPKCGADLTSPIENAGNTEQCQQCHREFVVPGEVELMRLHTRAERDREGERERIRQARGGSNISAAEVDGALDYESVQTAEARENARRQREASAAIAKMQRPGMYKDILSGAGVLGLLGTVSLALGIIAAGLGLIMIFVGFDPTHRDMIPTGLAALFGGIGYVILGAMLKLAGGVSLAIRDIAIQTHHTMIANAIPKPTQTADVQDEDVTA